ncbi:hypothetical protein [Vibrio nigripulchritudo]|nr:hypothetical protein [Vibrio nigripulchritudo]
MEIATEFALKPDWRNISQVIMDTKRTTILSRNIVNTAQIL